MTDKRGIGRRIANGAVWMVGFKLANRLIGLVSTIVLARLLTPADFGLVAMATAFIAILELATAFSFDVALIQRQNASRDYYDTAWTLNLLAFLAIAAVMALAASLVADFYREPAVTAILYVLAIGIAVQGLENIGTVAFRKDLRLDKEFGFLMTKRVIGVVVAISFALIWRTYWALVIAMVVGRVLGTLFSFAIHPFRPRFDLSRRRELMHVSKWLFINSILAVVIHRSAHFFVGRISGPASLGTFTVGHEIAYLPSSELSAPLSRAVFPGYSMIANDRGAIGETFLRVVAALAMVAVPAGLGIAAVAEPLIVVLLGSQWTGAVPVIKILALSSVMVALASNANYVCLAVNRPRNTTVIGVIHAIAVIPGLAILVPMHGAMGAAYAMFVGAAIYAPFAFAITSRIAGIKLSRVLGTMMRPLLAGLAMYAAVRTMATLVPGNTVVALGALVATGSIVYISLIWVMWAMRGFPDGTERMLLRRFRELRSRMSRR